MANRRTSTVIMGGASSSAAAAAPSSGTTSSSKSTSSTSSCSSLLVFRQRRDYDHIEMDDLSENSKFHYNAMSSHTELALDIDENDDNDNVDDNNAERQDEEEAVELSATALSFDECLERLGMGPFQYIILLAAGLCFASDAIQIMMLSFLSLVLSQEWNLSSTASAFLTSLLFAGSLLGTIILGSLADVVGRRRVFLITASILTLLGNLVALAPSYWILATLIFGVGVGVGGVTIPFSILVEVLPASQRGAYLLIIEYFWTLGVLYVVILAYLILDSNDHNHNSDSSTDSNTISHWRLFVALCTLPSFIALVVGYWFVPESARWLVTKGRTDEARCILHRMAAMNHGCDGDHDNFSIIISQMQVPPLAPEHEGEEEEKASFLTLFEPRWRGITLRLWGAWAGFAMGYYGTILTTTKIFSHSSSSESSVGGGGEHENENDGSLSSSPNNKGFFFDYTGILISSSAEFVGTTLVILTIDRCGRIPLQVVSYVLAGISVFLLCHLYFRPAVIAASFLARVFDMGATCVTWVSTAEIFSTQVRSSGHSSSNAMARMGAFFSPYIVQGFSTSTIGIIMLIVHVFTAICISQLPETAGTATTAESEGHVLLASDEREEHDVDDSDLLFRITGQEGGEQPRASSSSSSTDGLKLLPPEHANRGDGEACPRHRVSFRHDVAAQESVTQLS